MNASILTYEQRQLFQVRGHAQLFFPVHTGDPSHKFIHSQSVAAGLDIYSPCEQVSNNFSRVNLDTITWYDWAGLAVLAVLAIWLFIGWLNAHDKWEEEKRAHRKRGGTMPKD